MERHEVKSRIEAIGIVPSIRVQTTDDALFAAKAVARGGVPIVEVALTVPGAIGLISHLVQNMPGMIVGAGGVADADAARQCCDAGAQFLTSDGCDIEVTKFALERKVVVFPGALTPTEVAIAHKLKPDFVKIVPCGHMGGESYIRALKAMFPDVKLIAAGGVTQRNAFDFIRAGAIAVGVGGELIPREAVRHKQADRIVELAGRFLQAVKTSRAQFQGR